jgi:hypothetical protein
MSVKKQRKPLGDSLAQEFVYGEPPSTSTSPSLDSEPKSKLESETPTAPKETSLMDRLNLDITEPREATIRFTVDLPESMHRKLSILSAKTGTKKAHIVRKLLEQVLKNVDD